MPEFRSCLHRHNLGRSLTNQCLGFLIYKRQAVAVTAITTDWSFGWGLE